MTRLSVARNSLEFKKRVEAYNQQGEHLSEQMKSDLFVQGVPFFLKKKILDQIRTLTVAEGGFKFIRSLIQEIIGEKENKNKGNRERGNINLVKFKRATMSKIKMQNENAVIFEIEIAVILEIVPTSVRKTTVGKKLLVDTGTKVKSANVLYATRLIT